MPKTTSYLFFIFSEFVKTEWEVVKNTFRRRIEQLRTPLHQDPFLQQPMATIVGKTASRKKKFVPHFGSAGMDERKRRIFYEKTQKIEDVQLHILLEKYIDTSI